MFGSRPESRVQVTKLSYDQSLIARTSQLATGLQLRQVFGDKISVEDMQT